MDFRKILQTVVSYIPTVKRPRQNVSFKRKALWTISILLMYFIMTNIPILGLGQGGSDAFGQFRGILAGGQGSLLQLGIMPIVTASIVLQILTGTNIMTLDMNDPRDQDLYQGLRRLLIVAMVLINAIPVVYSGSYLPPSQGLVAQFGEFPILTLMLVQVAGGGLLLFYMDEIVSKWGIGSGLGLFIIAGISQRMIGGIFTQLIPGWWDIIVGNIQVQFSLAGAQIVLLGPGQLIPIITTVLIFIIVIGAESTKVQIPTNRKRSGVKGTYDVKLVYASVMPVILVRAIQANIQFIGSALDGLFGPSLPAFVGQFQDGQAYSGIFYYFTPILRPQDWMWWAGSTTAEPWMIILRIIVDFSFMTIGGALFAVFWVRTTNKDAEAIAKQLDVQDMEIPGFRSNASRMEKVLDRYIPYVTIIGGALIGALSVVANILGTIGMVGGTGLLLTVSITYKIYEEIKREMVESKYGDKFGLIG